MFTPTRRMGTLTATLGLLLAVGVVQAGSAAAAPPEPGNASCLGFEAAHVSPPGTSGEAPGGMPDLLVTFDELFVGPDGFKNRGELISFFTQLDADSHAACDEAFLDAVLGGA